ncbi:flavin-containing monooxygenase [Gillisia hiemivivida]|uniref:Potassium transporter Trk n=1 Tax=Gillisia hiemivivida TaxID=291190 RepID=A0A5C6ZUM5_9FLAO|nr:NAD(P)/FAD-dependent oxidoreductase [Gillisia hiemivivida]TXD94546.1 potassium transporter Trk [Gillisia hiemivivida]
MLDFIIIGSAQAGLSMAYHLKQLGKSFLVVDKEDKIGESWLSRWDSLRLFTPTEFNHLEGMEFPAPKGHYPNKYEVAAYFKSYVEKFEIPIQFNTLITSIEQKKGIFTLKHENGEFKCPNVIIATGPFHTPYTPPFSIKINKKVTQIHSNYYKNVEQLQQGDTLVVGGGDSGFQILDEISKDGLKTYFAGPDDAKTLPQEILGKTLWWWFTKTGFLSSSKHSWIGKVIANSPQPIIGINIKEILNRENVIPVGRALNADGNSISFDRNEVSTIKNVVWATGYRPNFNWIQGLELDKKGYPKNKRGISSIKGLYFIGLPWLYTRGSATLGGVKKDAAYISKVIETE